MAVRRILQLGDPLLRETSRPVSTPAEARTALEDLRDTLHDFQARHGFGRGISAVQIGETLRLIYLEYRGLSYALHNPVYTRMSEEKFTLWDDCFSFPDLLVKLERSVSVDIEYMDEHGKPQTLLAEGALSELLQHEMDHLDGILAVDRALDRNSLATREEFGRRYAAAIMAGTSA